MSNAAKGTINPLLLKQSSSIEEHSALDPAILHHLQQKYDYTDSDEAFVRSLPKVELHVHLDGAFDPELLYRHLEATQEYTCFPLLTSLPWNDALVVREKVQACTTPRDFHSLCTCRGKASLQAMIESFQMFTPLVQGNLALLEAMAYDFCQRQSAQNVIYTEVRYSPHLLAAGASLAGTEIVDAGPVLDAITAGLRRGCRDYDTITVNQILCCICWRPGWAMDIVRLCNNHQHDYPCAVVGIDIAAGEEHFTDPALSHVPAMEKAQELDIHVTMHAGEVGTAKNIRTAIEDYGAVRIGHGYHVVHDEELMTTIKERKIHIEVCPTSSVETGGWQVVPHQKVWKDHPATTMLQNKLNIGFNSDDPAVFDTSLSWQYRIALAKMRLSREELVQSIRDSIDAAFCISEEKERLHGLLNDFEAGVVIEPMLPYDERIGDHKDN
jgi:adenosine deaminase